MLRETIKPSETELAALRALPPTAAFGFCIQTAGKLNINPVHIPVLADSFKLAGGVAANGRWAGFAINIVATLEQMEQIDRAMAGRDFPLTSYHLLRDGANQVPVYDLDKRGATGVPMIRDRLTIA